MTNGAMLIGSTITGTDANGNTVKGTVSQVAMDSSGGVYLVVPQTSGTTTKNVAVPLGNVTSVSYPGVGSGTGTGS
jgi:hypothetical protein